MCVLGYNNFCSACKGSRKENGKLICRDRNGKFYGLPVKNVLLAPCIDAIEGNGKEQKMDTEKMINELKESAEELSNMIQELKGKNEKPELKTCPFCGGTVELDKYDFYMFTCNGCGAGIRFAKELEIGTVADCNKEESIEKWNRRAGNE